MAHKKAGGTTTNGRDSIAKRRGVKRFGGEIVAAGEILARQKGFCFRPGKNVYVGKDWTLHAASCGTVHFTKCKRENFHGKRLRFTIINVRPSQQQKA